MSNACYYPVTLYRSRMGRDKKTGRWPLVGIKDGYRDMPEKVPCGRCIGCRLEKSRQWAVRCVCEAQMHDKNCFVTLTYDDDSICYGKDRPTLVSKDLQLFWKRLRKEHGNGIRYFACGEYGERFGRPHYHACIFGFDFEDKKFHSSKNGSTIYTSDNLRRLWPFGHNAIGELTFESAAYVSRYIVDKKLGQASEFYDEHGIEPEFVRMSRRPGVGSSWMAKFHADVFPHDYMVIRNGIKVKPPKYYSNKYELDNPVEMRYIRERRKIEAGKQWRDNTRERLIVREKVKLAQIRSLHR